MLEKNKLYLGDCLEVMKEIDDKSIDMILCDLPYNMTACDFDKEIISLDRLWKYYKKVIKPQGVIILTGSQPFTSILVVSNLSWFRYSWIWEKESGSNFLLCKYQPMKVHEDILVFGKFSDIETNEELRQYFWNEKKKNGFTNKEINEMLGYATTGSGMAGHYFKKDKQQFMIPKKEDYEKLQQKTGFFQKPYNEIFEKYSNGIKSLLYNPQVKKGLPYEIKQGRGSEVYKNKDNAVITKNKGYRYPTSILKFNRDKKKYHPTQKPISLFEYLVKTYTNEKMLVLDNCAGSGTTAIACHRLKRNWICIEKDKKYYEIAQKRIDEELEKNYLFQKG